MSCLADRDASRVAIVARGPLLTATASTGVASCCDSQLYSPIQPHSEPCVRLCSRQAHPDRRGGKKNARWLPLRADDTFVMDEACRGFEATSLMTPPLRGRQAAGRLSPWTQGECTCEIITADIGVTNAYNRQLVLHTGPSPKPQHNSPIAPQKKPTQDPSPCPSARTTLAAAAQSGDAGRCVDFYGMVWWYTVCPASPKPPSSSDARRVRACP